VVASLNTGYVSDLEHVPSDVDIEASEPTVSRRLAPLLLGGVLLFALLLRILFVQTFLSPDDDVYYIRDAYLLAHGHFVHNTHWALRVGVVAPTALFIRIFGFHDWSVILYPLCLSLLGIVLIYALGATFFSREVGLLAAFLLACFPENIYYSTLVLADLPGTLYGSLAVLLAYLSRDGISAPRTTLLCAASGLALVLSYLCWEVNLLFVPICCLAVVLHHDRRTVAFSIVTILAIVAAAIALESLVYWKMTGEPLLRWTLAHHAESAATGSATISVRDYLLRVPKTYLNPANKLSFLYSWLVMWAVFALRKSLLRTEVLFVLVWLVVALGFLGFGIYNLHPLRTLLDIEYPRYFDDLSYPAILLVALALYQTGPSRHGAKSGMS
jgi:4-amino-4-deoxy-L-arabinose transferase-like glycosyltransferase